MEAIPTPTPPINLANTNWVRLLGIEEPTAEIKNKIAERISTYLRPNLSLKNPAKMTPIIHPQIALEAAQPVSAGLKSNIV